MILSDGCRELEDMSEFIKSASTHEADARNKLEKFIGDILDRAQKAEDEVQSLKSQLSVTPLLHSQATTPLFNPRQVNISPAETFSTFCWVELLLSLFAQDHFVSCFLI